MEFIRLLHPRNFDRERNRFNDLSFKALDGGVSVVHRECVDRIPSTICEHIRNYYRNETGEPPVFFLFQEEILPEGYRIKASVSTSGDPCHHDITNVSDNRLWKFFKRRAWTELYICDNGGFRPLKQTDIDSFPN